MRFSTGFETKPTERETSPFAMNGADARLDIPVAASTCKELVQRMSAATFASW